MDVLSYWHPVCYVLYVLWSVLWYIVSDSHCFSAAHTHCTIMTFSGFTHNCAASTYWIDYRMTRKRKKMKRRSALESNWRWRRTTISATASAQQLSPSPSSGSQVDWRSQQIACIPHCACVTQEPAEYRLHASNERHGCIRMYESLLSGLLSIK